MACYGFGPRQRWTQALTSVAFSMVALDARVVTAGAPLRCAWFPGQGFCPAREVSTGVRDQVSLQDDRRGACARSAAEIDITTADELRAVLLATAARGYVTVVVDLTVTRFCDCCGLHALLRAHQLAQADGGELRLVIPADGLVPRILVLTCLDYSIPCFASLKEAVAQIPAAANGRRDARGPDADQPPMQTAIKRRR